MNKKTEFTSPLKFIPLIFGDKKDLKSQYNFGKPFASSSIIRQLSCLNNKEANNSSAALLKQMHINEYDVISERWIVSDDSTYPSQVSFFDGDIILPFNKLLERFGEELLGKEHINTFGKQLPVIMKQIDTNEDSLKGSMSVKLHPKTGHPLRRKKPKLFLGSGSIYLGWKKDISKEQILQSINNGTLEKDMNIIQLDSLNAVSIPGGTVFAIRHNTFLYEFSQPPWAETIDPSDNSCQTVSFYDRTDGKIPKRSNEDINGGMDILRHANNLSEYKEKPLISKEIYKDAENNKMILRAETPEFFIEEIHIKTTIEMSTVMRGFPVYLQSGNLEISVNDKTIDEMNSGDESFFPATMGQFKLKAKNNCPAVLLKWYAPFPWMLEHHI